MSGILPADWDLPSGLRAITTICSASQGQSGYGDFNLAAHVGDDLRGVEYNRKLLLQQCDGLAGVQWLEQVHGTHVHFVDKVITEAPVADAAIGSAAGIACAVLTADCLPVLFCNSRGTQVAAAHAGWRGLLGGALLNTVKAFADEPFALHAWFGPCIRQAYFEVGAEVRGKFLSSFVGPSASDIEAAFETSASSGRYLCDLAALAALQLRALGVQNIIDSGLCSYDDPRFYSYRRENPCGRTATLIYRQP